MAHALSTITRIRPHAGSYGWLHTACLPVGTCSVSTSRVLHITQALLQIQAVSANGMHAQLLRLYMCAQLGGVALLCHSGVICALIGQSNLTYSSRCFPACSTVQLPKLQKHSCGVSSPKWRRCLRQHGRARPRR
jgi:hypothetical protein